MTTITFEELQERLVEVFDQLARGGEPVAVTRDGAVVTLRAAELDQGPTREMTADVTGGGQLSPRKDPDPFVAAWERVAALVERDCPEPMSAVEAIREQRRG